LTLSEGRYQEAVDALFTQLPMFQRQGPAAYKAHLGATRTVCQVLGNPERDLRFVHVAGTNGKGTVCHMVAASLQAAGHKVGLFTSPHLVDFRERIRVNGAMISKESVVDFVERWQTTDGWGTPSFFELTFGMALDHFRTEACDIVVLETGMGGRLDSTNVIPTAEVCVITNIGLDHQQFLGPDIRSIAREKAGILKDGVPVVLGPMRPEAQSEILQVALRTASESHAAREASADWLEDGTTPHGDSPFERANRQTALATLRILAPSWSLHDSHMRSGILGHRKLTHQAGRWQWIQLMEGPSLVLDGAHNLDGVQGIVQGLVRASQRTKGRLHVVWGCVGDKDPTDVMSLLPVDATYHWCRADIPRAMPLERLTSIRPELGGQAHPTALDAVQAAIRGASIHDLIWVGGSLFVVGDVLRDAPEQVAGWPTVPFSSSEPSP
jgi:dihydrofolate synthase/folylpolyglutamate synthase